MTPMIQKWTCQCGAFSCTFTFNAGATSPSFPISLCAPCCGDEMNLTVEDEGPPAHRSRLRVV